MHTPTRVEYAGSANELSLGYSKRYCTGQHEQPVWRLSNDIVDVVLPGQVRVDIQSDYFRVELYVRELHVLSQEINIYDFTFAWIRNQF